MRIGEVTVGPVAIGCARLTMSPWAPSERTAVATIHAALDAGIRYLDTANCYSDSINSAGANERLVARALRSWHGRSYEVLVGTKGGRWRPGDGTFVPDGRPSTLRAACDASLAALGVDAIGLYLLHIPDPEVPYEDSVGTLAELVAAGKVRSVGVSNVTVDQLEVATSMVEVAAVQNALSPRRHDWADLDVAARCGDEGVPFLAWGPLRGVEDDATALAEHPALMAAAETLGVTVRQVTLAWCRSLASTVVPVAGPTAPGQIAELIGAADLVIPAEIRATLPVPDGGRFTRARPAAAPGARRMVHRNMYNPGSQTSK